MRVCGRLTAAQPCGGPSGTSCRTGRVWLVELTHGSFTPCPWSCDEVAVPGRQWVTSTWLEG